MGIKQPSLSTLERTDRIILATMRRFVHEIGGELDIVVRLPARHPSGSINSRIPQLMLVVSINNRLALSLRPDASLVLILTGSVDYADCVGLRWVTQGEMSLISVRDAHVK